MSATTDEERVRAALHDMLREGELPLVPLSGGGIRIRSRRRAWPRIDPKLVATVAAAIVLVAVLFAAIPHRPSSHSPVAAPGLGGRHASTAYSAYGVQLSVPKSWSVRYFPGCPNTGPQPELSIGQSAVAYNCPTYRSARAVGVSLVQGNQLPRDRFGKVQSSRTIRVHGLHVEVATSTGLQSPTPIAWYVPSKDVSVTGAGTGALQVMETLASARPGAVVTPGDVKGYQYLETLQQLPVSGPVTVTDARSGTSSTIYAIEGEYTFSGRPGGYIVQGHDGNAPCPPVTVEVVSGEHVTAPPIRCQGA
jgi:hypothetical protein